jgi:hypothetical protein
MGKGKRFELDTKNAINEHTKRWVKAHRPDFSGSSTGEVADIMVVWQANRYHNQRPSGHPERHVAYGELKKRSGTEGNRSTVMDGSSQDQNGLEELQELNSESPPWTKKVVGFKFPRREMVVLDANVFEHWLRRDEEGWGNPVEKKVQFGDMDEADFHGARLTPSDNISMVMPEKDDWPTQSTGLDPWEKFSRSIGLEPYDFKEDN